jgi:hypothetical protein
MAHALLSGRTPRQLTLTEIKKIEKSLEKARQLLNPPRQAFQMAAYIKYDYYLRSGMLAKPSPRELISQSASAIAIAGESERLASLYSTNRDDDALQDFFAN